MMTSIMKKILKIKYLSFILLLVVLFFNFNNEVTFETNINYTNHSDIFNYVITIDNFPILNPTIMAISNRKLINETNFVIDYIEYLSQIPFIKNYGQGRYRTSKSDDDSYIIQSEHSTCFYSDYLCLPTTSNVHISQRDLQVHYTEHINYTCPWILSKFCYNEVLIQRKLIFDKLKEIFSKK